MLKVRMETSEDEDTTRNRKIAHQEHNRWMEVKEWRSILDCEMR
jgi:hypothetical protein